MLRKKKIIDFLSKKLDFIRIIRISHSFFIIFHFVKKLKLPYAYSSEFQKNIF